MAISKLEAMNLDKNNSKRQKNCKNLTRFDYLRLLAILKYFRMVKDIPRRRIESSQMVADMFFGKSGASYRARTIRDWSDYYLKHSELPLLRQGKYQKTKSLIDDEDVKSACLSFLRSLPAEQRTAVTFERWINSELKGQVGIEYDLSVSKRTAHNWLVKLGFQYQEHRQGSAYVDGHERPDVVAHRNRFVDEMNQWQRRMEKFVGDEMETCIQPEICQEESKVVLLLRTKAFFKLTMALDGFGKKRLKRILGRKDLEPQ